MSEVLHAVLGTAGHIDHGKSSLVKALTGTDPDRFPEEQARGMTIDIGFAEYRTASGVDVGIIDVPGHERFVRNMVAGAAGIDVVMLVVAADDGVMPQTREHLDILTLLGLRRGFVVLSKIDMVDAEMRALVEEELREFLSGTFLEGAPILPVSAVTGEGLLAVRHTIDALVADLPARTTVGVFRMPVQRSFTLKGHGTVVTGVPVAGEVRPGDEVEVLPLGARSRVRAIQVHHRPAESGAAGHRTALNLGDVHYKDIQRGHVVCAPGYFRASRLLEARFRVVPTWRGPVQDGVPVRFHSGAAELIGTLALLETASLEPGEEGFVQIRLEEPAVVAPGDPYLLRQVSPERTMGGGIVLGETRFRFKRFRDWIQENLKGKEESLGDRERYLEYVVRSEGLHAVAVDSLPVLVKESPEAVARHLAVLREAGRIVDLRGSREVVHRDMLERGLEEVQKALAALHEADPYPFGFTEAQVAGRLKHPRGLVELCLELGRSRGLVETQGGLFRLRSFTGGLSHEDRRLAQAVEERLRAGRFATPIPADLAEALGRPRKRIENILTLLVGRGRVVRLDENVYLHADSVREARDLLVDYVQRHGEMPSNAMKDVIGATRKYVIPLLEHFDAIGLTVRRDSSRVLKEGYERVLPAPPDGAEAS
jgi:selenocysteine-specific elongation factor